MSQSRFRVTRGVFAAFVFALLWGCVEAPARPDRELIAPLRAEVDSNPKPPPLELSPEMRRPDHASHHVHVDGAVSCTGTFQKQLAVYAAGWVTAPGYTGDVVPVASLDTEIHVLGGLFEGRIVRSQKGASPDFSDVGVVLKGNPSSDPCGCVRIVANAKAPGGVKIRARKDRCPEGMQVATATREASEE